MKIISRFLMIGGSVVTTIHLSRLVPTDPDFVASWGKLVFAVILVISGFVISMCKSEDLW